MMRRMDRCPPRAACAALLVLALLPASRAAADVTVYRCTDAAGVVTLQDAPCAAGSHQEVRTMQRPQDPPPGSRTPPATVTQAPPPEPAQVVVATRRAPQPMYECVTPDGERYTSDTGQGNPRWVPLWTLGYRSRSRGGPAAVDGGALGDYYADRPAWGRVGAPTPRPDPPASGSGRPDRPSRPHRGGFGGPGTWVRDTCHALPQGEVCSRLVDRREQIRRRFFNAQPSERDALRVEERGINARLAADCGQR